MKNGLQLTLVFFVSFIIISCQKKFNNPEARPELPVVTSHDSLTRLSKVILMNTAASSSDTFSIYEYFYDNAGRVSNINVDIPKVPSLFCVITYFYNNSDSLAWKKTKIYPDPFYNSDSTSYFYFYDNFQQLVKDSVIFSYATEVDYYKYTGAMVTAMKRTVDTASPNNPYLEADTAFIGATGDVIKTNSFTSGLPLYETSFTYDDKPNPFYQLNIRTTYFPVPNFNYYIEDFYLEKNNIIFINQAVAGCPGLPATSKYNYTYDASGWPVSADIINQLGTRSNSGIKFIYKKI